MLVSTISWAFRLPRVTVWDPRSGRASGHEPQQGKDAGVALCLSGAVDGLQSWPQPLLDNLVRQRLKTMFIRRVVLLVWLSVWRGLQNQLCGCLGSLARFPSQVGLCCWVELLPCFPVLAGIGCAVQPHGIFGQLLASLLVGLQDVLHGCLACQARLPPSVGLEAMLFQQDSLLAGDPNQAELPVKLLMGPLAQLCK